MPSLRSPLRNVLRTARGARAAARTVPLLLAAALAACVADGTTASPSPPSAPDARPTQPASVPIAAADPGDGLAALRALIGPATCDDASQCRSLPVGAKACGGPEAYLAWSTQVTDAQALQRAAAAYEAQRRSFNERSGRLSTCEFVTDPGVQCVRSEGGAGACRLLPGRGRGVGGPAEVR